MLFQKGSWGYKNWRAGGGIVPSAGSYSLATHALRNVVGIPPTHTTIPLDIALRNSIPRLVAAKPILRKWGEGDFV